MSKEEELNEQVKALIARDFDLDFKEQKFTEEELFNVLADQIAWMVENRIEFLLSLMYRMDVLEKDINMALHPANEDPANIALAKLVWDRQKQRIFTKQQYKQEKIDDDEWAL